MTPEVRDCRRTSEWKYDLQLRPSTRAFSPGDLALVPRWLGAWERQSVPTFVGEAFLRKGFRRDNRLTPSGRMICPRCGTSNRDGATYCDSCAEPLSEAAEKTSSRSEGLVGMMTFDWTMRSLLAGLFGIVGAVVAASQGAWGFVVLFALISLAGWGFLAYTVRNAP